METHGPGYSKLKENFSKIRDKLSPFGEGPKIHFVLISRKKKEGRL